jgi:hypothetical protein
MVTMVMSKAKKRGNNRAAEFKAAIKQVREQPHALDKADEELLKRWEKDDGHNAIEASISIVEKASEGEDIHQFEALAWLIHIVIFVKDYSEAADQLSSELTELRRKRNKLEKTYRNRLAKNISSNSITIDRLSDFLTKVAVKLANIKKTQPANLPLRSSHDGSRPRTLFMAELSNVVNDLTGSRLDIDVAALTDIAFPRSEPTSVDAVRSARRPSTRKGRGSDSRRKSRNRSR